MPYSPPAWSAVSFDFADAYTPPAWSGVGFDLAAEGSSPAQYVSPSAIDQSGSGSPAVRWNQYISPAGIVGASSGSGRLYHRYIITKNLAFGSEYSPPSWSASSFAFGGVAGELFVDGFDASAFGSASIDNSTRFLLATGFNASSIGDPALIFTQFLLPSSVNDGAIGMASLRNRNETLFPIGIAGFKGFGFAGDGDGFIDFLERSLSPTGISISVFGTCTLTNQHRYVDLAGLSIVGGYGTAQVAYKLREIFPSYIYSYASGYPTMGGTQLVTPDGIDATTIGLQYVHDNRQYPVPEGFVGTSYGFAELTRSPRLLQPTSIVLSDLLPSEQWGIQTIYNSRQFVGQLFGVTPSDGGVFGDPIWMQVDNRNRLIHTYGHKDSAVSGLAKIDNKAVPLLASGIPGAWGSALVAYRIRNVYPEPIDQSYITPYHAAYNNLRPIAPSGFRGDDLGVPSFQNTRRYYTLVGYDAALYGVPFVAPAIRGITVPLGPEATLGYHDVELKTRYIVPASIDGFGAGGPFLEERFTIFYPSSIMAGRAGMEHYVRNNTPEVTPYGNVLTLWGDNAIHLQYRFVEPVGVGQTLWGGNAIADRTFTVVPAGSSTLRMGYGHSVRNDSPDQPWSRDIGPASFVGSYWGQAYVHSNDIVPDGLAATKWGSHTVLFLGAYPAGIAPLVNYIPAPWIKGPQYVTAPSIYAPDDSLSSSQKTKHDLKPRTIWATFDVTEQALENHVGAWQLMDRVLHQDNNERPVFGVPAATLYRRGMSPTSFSPTTVGDPAVELRHRRIYPTGLKPKALGIPSIPFAREMLDVSAGSFTGFGDHFVENQHRQIFPDGLGPDDIIETHYVDFYNRTLTPSGVDAFTSTGEHRLHPPEPIIPVGLDATLWGDSWTSNWYRGVTPEGFDASGMSDMPGGFSDRIRVTRTGKTLRARSVVPAGLGIPSVSSIRTGLRTDIFTAA